MKKTPFVPVKFRRTHFTGRVPADGTGVLYALLLFGRLIDMILVSIMGELLDVYEKIKLGRNY